MKKFEIAIITDLSKGDRFYKQGGNRKNIFEYSHHDKEVGKFYFYPMNGERVVTLEEKTGRTPFNVVFLRSTN